MTVPTIDEVERRAGKTLTRKERELVQRWIDLPDDLKEPPPTPGIPEYQILMDIWRE